MELGGRERRMRGAAGLVSNSNSNKLPLLCCCTCVLLLFSICALLSTVTEIKSSSNAGFSHAQRAKSRRQLSARGGPGSFPPRCSAKCGACTPCSPVRVPVHPGTPVTTEYYPEAWRCKCGNGLYMP